MSISVHETELQYSQIPGNIAFLIKGQSHGKVGELRVWVKNEWLRTGTSFSDRLFNSCDFPR
jgi:hypothetical protein